MPRIKRHVQKGFTTVNNDFLRDTSLALAERGLLITMLSLPDGWNMSGRGLASILPDGRDKVFSTLKKLERKGYLKRELIRENGLFVDTEYQFCDMPVFKEENEKNLRKKEERKKAKKIQEEAKRELLIANLVQELMREIRENEIVREKLNRLQGEELMKFVRKEVFKEEKIKEKIPVPDKLFSEISTIFIQVFETQKEKRETLINASPLDVLALLEKTRNKKERQEIILNYFLEEGVFLK